MEGWLQFAQGILMAIVTVVVWVAYRAFRAGQWSQTVDHTKEIRALEDRMQRAGTEMSNLSTKVQRMPEDMRVIFVPREVFAMFAAQSESDRKWLYSEVEKLWTAGRRRDESRPQ